MKKRIGFIIPNTDKQVRYGKLCKWPNFNENQIVYQANGREKEDILQSVKKGYREFYLRPQYFWNVLPLFNKDDWWKFLKICSSAYKLLLPS